DSRGPANAGAVAARPAVRPWTCEPRSATAHPPLPQALSSTHVGSGSAGTAPRATRRSGEPPRARSLVRVHAAAPTPARPRAAPAAGCHGDSHVRTSTHRLTDRSSPWPCKHLVARLDPLVHR